MRTRVVWLLIWVGLILWNLIGVALVLSLLAPIWMLAFPIVGLALSLHSLQRDMRVLSSGELGT